MNLHILGSCTATKSLPPLEQFYLRNYDHYSFEQRMFTYYLTLTAHRPEISVQNLYGGTHWQIVKEIPSAARDMGFEPKLWAMSAAYGLIESTDLVNSYSATFSTANADSVYRPHYRVPSRFQILYWWDLLCKVTKRSIHALDGNVLVIGTPSYIEAIEEDLSEAKRRLEDRLIIVASSPFTKGHPLNENVVLSTAKIAKCLQAPCCGVQAALAKQLVYETRDYGWGAEKARVRWAQIEKNLPDLDRPQRDTTDEILKRLADYAKMG